MAVGANTPSSMASASQNFDLIFNLKKKIMLKIKEHRRVWVKLCLVHFLCQNKIDLHTSDATR